MSLSTGEAGRRGAVAGSVVGSTSAALTSAVASVCCVGPLAITLLGVNGVILAAAFKPYRWYILAASLVLLALAWWGVYRGWRVRPGAACGVRAGRATQVVLWVSVAVWLTAVAVNLFVNEYWLKGGGTL